MLWSVRVLASRQQVTLVRWHLIKVGSLSTCESSAWRMNAVKGIRNDDDFYSKYMTGAYGAVPQL